VVVVTGAGGKAFVSGADISKFESERSTLDATKVYNATVEQAYAASRTFPSRPSHDPWLLHRRRLGLAVCLRPAICSDNSRFAVPAAKLGLAIPMPGCGGSAIWSAPPSPGSLLHARQFDTEEARAMGPGQSRVPHGRLEDYVKSSRVKAGPTDR